MGNFFPMHNLLFRVDTALKDRVTQSYCSLNEDDDPDYFLDVVGALVDPTSTNFLSLERELRGVCSDPRGARWHPAAQDIALWMLHQTQRDAKSCGFRVLSLLVGLGDSWATLNFASAIIRGDGTRRSPQTGRAILEGMTGNKDATPSTRQQAHILLSRAWEKGDFGGIDIEQCHSHLKCAADLGSATAAFNLGVLLDDKEGNPHPDYEAAARYYQMAADLGHCYARTNLGILHASGRIAAADKSHGRALLEASARKGDREAVRAISMMSSEPSETAQRNQPAA